MDLLFHPGVAHMKIWKRWGVLAAAGFLALIGVQPADADSTGASCAAFTVNVVRMENPKSNSVLLTQFASEQKSAASYGYIASNEVAFKAAASPGAGLVAVWRMYNPTTSDFTWSADGADRQAMTMAGYEAQFAQFYASVADVQCLSSAYRLRKGDKSRTVVGAVARDGLVREGWVVANSGMFQALVPRVPAEVPSPAPVPTPSPTPVPTPPSGPVPTPSPSPAPTTPLGNGMADAANEAEFTIAVLPDTQQETWSDSDTKFKNRSEWLVANAQEQNLKFVTHVGDVVDWGSVAPQQYTRAKNGLSPLNGRLPYSLSVGNHDTAAVCQGGSACPGKDASVTVRDTTAFNAAFPRSTFTNLKGEFENGKVDNSFSTFDAGGRKWMVLNIELWPRQVAIDWAKTVVASHPDHNVIIATHSYLDAAGNISTSSGGYGSTSPKWLFDTLVKTYPNIKMVVSGHTGGSAARVDTGVNGNKILSLLQCFHSQTTNPVRLIRINALAGTVTNWVYAPYTHEMLVPQSVVTGFDFSR